MVTLSPLHHIAKNKELKDIKDQLHKHGVKSDTINSIKELKKIKADHEK